MHSGNDPIRFPLSPSEAADRYYRDHLTRIVSLIPERLGDARPLALLLGGSLALGEACALPGAEGPAPGSDIDLYLVVDGGEGEDLKRRVAALRDRMLASLETPGLVVDLGTITPERLGRLRPTIAHATLARRGRTIWGDPSILDGAARPRFDEIPGSDGYLLLLNRTVEELVELRPAGECGEAEGEVWYRTGKTFRDLGASALVAAGRFAPGLEEQREAVRLLFGGDGEGPTAAGFIEEHHFWCDRKLRPDPAAIEARYGGGSAGMRRVQILKRDALESIHRWELRGVWGLPEGSDERSACRRAARFPRRARRWGEYLLREGPTAIGPALRQLAAGLPATPLDATYAAAVRLLLAWGPIHGAGESDEDRRHLAAAYRNAVRRPARTGDFRTDWMGLRNEVCAFWDREVMGGTRPARERSER
ncbi:MAG: hypothetical protein JW958_06770 [Candidatus Eisenbacteria bacterium]|nr:hypothetical protein [Candidatus Eisenbacteria bacterium]